MVSVSQGLDGPTGSDHQMRIGINGTAQVPRGDVAGSVAHATTAEADGFASYWLPELPTGGVDVLTMLTLIGQSVTAMELGTAIVPTFPRHPMALAAQALTVNSVIPSRFTLGIGLSHRSMMNDLGIDSARPIRHLIDYLSILGPLLEHGTVDHQGELFSCTATVLTKPENSPDVLVAALGAQTLRVAGARTAGTSLAWVGPRTVAGHIVPTMSDAAERAGRAAPRILATLPICVTSEPGPARERLAQTADWYATLPSYAAMFEREQLVEPVDIALIGTADEVEERLHGLAASGITDFAASELGTTPDEWAATRELLVRVAASAP